jgi:hypothetical protein
MSIRIRRVIRDRGNKTKPPLIRPVPDAYKGSIYVVSRDYTEYEAGEHFFAIDATQIESRQ